MGTKTSRHDAGVLAFPSVPNLLSGSASTSEIPNASGDPRRIKSEIMVITNNVGS